jgi:hypothetical protein
VLCLRKNMGIVRGCRRTTINANEVTRGSRLVLMSNISANECALKVMDDVEVEKE